MQYEIYGARSGALFPVWYIKALFKRYKRKNSAHSIPVTQGPLKTLSMIHIPMSMTYLVPFRI